MRFLDYIMSHDKVWVPARLQIAQCRQAQPMDLAANTQDIG
jgi:hypothetical protein